MIPFVGNGNYDENLISLKKWCLSKAALLFHGHFFFEENMFCVHFSFFMSQIFCLKLSFFDFLIVHLFLKKRS